MNIRTLVIASNNKKKRAEIEHILKSLNLEVVPAAQTVFVDVVEDGDTFAANAKKKADAFMMANQLPALADDSGLCVSALHGAPGVYSARFSGENATDADNNTKLLLALKGLEERSAYFICALHLSLPEDMRNSPDITAEGRTEGMIIDQETGDTGFGYDPLFFSPELGKTFAQSAPEEKALVSHRGKALRLLQRKLANNS